MASSDEMYLNQTPTLDKLYMKIERFDSLVHKN